MHIMGPTFVLPRPWDSIHSRDVRNTKPSAVEKKKIAFSYRIPEYKRL